ncbi:formylglycine-generating enzyme family protein [Thiolinea disciformis]|uniref:formylglycine-generating enzyme family protein n=1 Tax=Thiolinea disciformis TaxID=125614 RepID=UPI00036A98CB|nr:formylglycine-generating enzyme family protein [Thiolinea disciformis]
MADENEHETEAWDEVVSGKRLPVAGKGDDEEAEAVRQVLLWRQAREQTAVISPEQAAAFYQRSEQLRRERLRSSRGKTLSLLVVVGLGLLGAGLGLGWWLSQPTTLSSAVSTPTTTQPMIPAAAPPSDMPQMIALAAGSFTMGCTAGWDDQLGGCRENEYPAHSVQVKGFAIARHEITVQQFKRFVDDTSYVTTAEFQQQGCAIQDLQKPSAWVISPNHNWRNPSFTQPPVHPVVCVSWQDAQAYAEWLSKKTGHSYRLPTEAEWEYAARGGKITAFYWGSQPDRNFANILGVEGKDQWAQTAPVGQFAANPFGLHDMAGNVWEWTADCWQQTYQITASTQETCSQNAFRARRGGGWDNVPASARSAARSPASLLDRSYVLGFRVVKDLP